MKVSRDLLKSVGIAKLANEAAARQQATAEGIVTGKPLVETKIKDITYDKSKADLEQPPPERSLLQQLNEDHATKLGLKVVGNLKLAIVGRANGERVVSPREADILFRKGIKDEVEDDCLLLRVLTTFSAFITEGNAYDPANPWMLRYRYNRGVHWRDHERAKSAPQYQAEGDQRLTTILAQLANEHGLPAHPPEILYGFRPELVRPETHNQTQFAEGAAR